MTELGEVLMSGDNKQKEAFDRIKKMIGSEKIVISRVPASTKKGFVEFARAEYCDDWGMAFKFLWDYYNSVCPELSLIDMRITALEQKLQQPVQTASTTETRHIRLLNGNNIEVKK